MEKMFIIINPVSANKTTEKEWPKFDKLLRTSGYEYEAVLTEYPGHASILAKEALKSGFRTIMSVGGDGTMNEVVNGFFEEGRPLAEDAELAIFSRGTGCDFIRALGIGKDVEDLLNILERKRKRQVDVGRVSFTGPEGNTVVRYFMNVADIGMGAEAANRVNKNSKLLKGFASFLLGAVGTMLLYRNKDFELVIDEEITLKERLNSVIIANGQYFGGGMKVAPEALIDDGAFDIVVLGDLSKPELFKSFPRIYEGRHLSHPKVRLYRGKKVLVKSGGKGLIEVDGEIPGSDDAFFEILPKALTILC